MDDTSYKGASLSAKELLSWRPLRHSADVELDGELSTLVARSRDLIRNNGIASGAKLFIIQIQKRNQSFLFYSL